MAESQLLTVIRIWAAMAWADGVLAEAEAEGLRRLIRSAELTEADRNAANQLLEENVALPDTALTNLSPDARKGIYKAACRMAVVDHVFAATERTMLDKIRDKLGVPPDVAAELESDIPGLAH
jgi:uncharacterized membrane protein YebE (DUF533 family)